MDFIEAHKVMILEENPCPILFSLTCKNTLGAGAVCSV